MGQFYTTPSTIYKHGDQTFESQSSGVLTVPDELDPVFRNVHGLASWFPASVQNGTPIPVETSVAVEPAEHEAEA
jgi:hypothetical protein